MIRIRILRNEKLYIDQYIIDGHSKNEPSEMVCSGISAITQTTALGLESLLKRKLKIQSADGYLNVRLLSPADEQTNLLTETMMLGIRTIDKKYPGNMVITDIHRK